MKFLLDEQMPPVLAAEWFTARGYQAFHVRDLGLRSSPDRDVWQRALEMDAVIMTKDRDYAIRRRAVKAGPVIVWLRFGNLRPAPFLQKLDSAWSNIEKRLRDGDTLIEAN